jgi:AbrB family looped-hinge helix DNA binding protein
MVKTSNIMQAKVSTKGWIVIPAPLRRRFGLKPGALVELQEAGDKIVIIPRTSNPIDELYGKLGGEVSLTEALLKDRTRELEREENKLRT